MSYEQLQLAKQIFPEYKDIPDIIPDVFGIVMEYLIDKENLGISFNNVLHGYKEEIKKSICCARAYRIHDETKCKTCEVSLFCPYLTCKGCSSCIEFDKSNYYCSWLGEPFIEQRRIKNITYITIYDGYELINFYISGKTVLGLYNDVKIDIQNIYEFCLFYGFLQKHKFKKSDYLKFLYILIKGLINIFKNNFTKNRKTILECDYLKTPYFTNKFTISEKNLLKRIKNY